MAPVIGASLDPHGAETAMSSFDEQQKSYDSLRSSGNASVFAKPDGIFPRGAGR